MEFWRGTIIPRIAEEEVLNRAFEKARKEQDVRRSLEEGTSATSVFAEFGIL